MNTVHIIDYGIGNIFNIRRAVADAGGNPVLTSRPEDLAAADKVILPGVGAFGNAMQSLALNGMDEAIKTFVTSGKPLLGICLGMQLLFSRSDEFGDHTGLDLVPGSVERLPITDGSKLPHIGWSKLLCPTEEATAWNEGLFKGLTMESYAYFVHSFAAKPLSPEHVLSYSSYGHSLFCSTVSRDNVWGCQFHPELSFNTGKAIFQNFLAV
ncbi:imidazole glycerol phosphate synthase subunit HisH [Desulfovibrio psychrotolerans]|uniref:Imidazole glycerol phosphate synthase subunit HisH n=1 Tax=Desulfovibrio psychrotolerans TaxID=415242 RepID=A0A7J0BY55_9BACT|nr:imidazole glycerol phosphate synthase subunit HisH [Desulfovibrio psychrotolerans]GFM38112.1 imidazole glycerol phosphate synthase subunit HisH 1 [Desulfovibrio psychrotolerans]